MNNRFALILVALVVGFAGILWFNKKKDTSPSTSQAALTNHVKGANKKNVTLIEYGDFECSACYYYEPVVQQVIEKYKDDIAFQFRHFPLTAIHQHAMAGHRAAEAAARQGKFWEMHDILFQNAHQVGQDGKLIDIEWTATTNPQPFFDKYAKTIGLDLEKFKTDMKSDEVNAAINADLAEGKRLGLSGTPSFILDGKKIDTPNNLEGFSKLIDEAIKAKSQQ